MSRSTLLLLGVLAVAGCRHPRLTVTFKVNGPNGRDFARLLALTDAPENSVTFDADKAIIDFKQDLEMPTREGLMKALDTVKRVDQRSKGPFLAWRKPGLEPDLLQALGLEASLGARDFPIKLRVREGSSAIKVRKTVFDALSHEPGDQICVYEIPLDDSLPDSAFKESPELPISASKLSPDLRRRLRAGLDQLRAEGAADHSQIVALDSELADLTKDMFLEKNEILNIPLGAPSKLYAENVLNTASHGEFAACHQSIVSGGEALLRDLVFPDISGRIKDYSLDQAF